MASSMSITFTRRPGESLLDRAIRLHRVIAEKEEQKGQQELHDQNPLRAASTFMRAAEHWHRLGIIFPDIKTKGQYLDNWRNSANLAAALRAIGRK